MSLYLTKYIDFHKVRPENYDEGDVFGFAVMGCRTTKGESSPAAAWRSRPATMIRVWNWNERIPNIAAQQHL